MMSSFRRGFSLVSFLGVSHVFIFYFWLLFSLRHGSRSCSLDLTLGISGLSGALRFSLPVTLCRICRIVLHRMPGGVKILKTCRFQVPLRFQALLQVLFLVNGSRLVLYRLATKLLPLT